MFVASDERGDAWVKAPDGSMATLIWQTGEPSYFKVTIEPNERRWGTFTVQLPLPMTNDDEAGSYLAALLPDPTAEMGGVDRRARRGVPRLTRTAA